MRELILFWFGLVLFLVWMTGYLLVPDVTPLIHILLLVASLLWGRSMRPTRRHWR